MALTSESIEVDPTFPAQSRHTSEEILAEIKATYHYQLFSGVVHGFALRGDMDNENERRSIELPIALYISD
jgi:Dienelactone hydrolase family